MPDYRSICWPEPPPNNIGWLCNHLVNIIPHLAMVTGTIVQCADSNKHNLCIATQCAQTLKNSILPYTFHKIEFLHALLDKPCTTHPTTPFYNVHTAPLPTPELTELRNEVKDLKNMVISL